MSDHQTSWLAVQIIEPLGTAAQQRYPSAVAEALGAHDVQITDAHPAVDAPDTLIVRCAALPPDPTARLQGAADLLARLLKLPSAQAVRIAAYPDRATAHAAVGGRA